MENPSRDGTTRPPYLSPEKSVCRLRINSYNWTGSKFGKEYVKAVYCHPANLTYMKSTSCKMPGWVKHKLESRFLGEISITSDIQMTLPLWQKVQGTKEPFDERGEWKVGLKPKIRKTKIMASSPITSWQTGKQWEILILGAPKSLQMVTAAMKWKDACSLQEKLWPT